MSVSIGVSGLLVASNSAWDNQDGTPATQSSVNINYTSGNVGIGLTNPNSDLQVNGSVSETVTIVTTSITLNDTHNKVLVQNGATNINITLPDALTCLGRKYEFSRYAGSSGGITLVRTGTNTIQSLTGTIAATTAIGTHSATGGGLRHSFTAVNIGGVGVWVRL